MCAEHVEIPLRRRDGSVRAVALVDEADGALAEHRWHLGDKYVERNATRGGAKIRLHREILGLQPGDGREGDHVSGDRLDNRRENLRIVTHAGNSQNVPKRVGCTSRYRGVSWNNHREMWQVVMAINKRQTYLGCFEDEHEAGRVAASYRAQYMEFVNEARSVAPQAEEAPCRE